MTLLMIISAEPGRRQTVCREFRDLAILEQHEQHQNSETALARTSNYRRGYLTAAPHPRRLLSLGSKTLVLCSSSGVRISLRCSSPGAAVPRLLLLFGENQSRRVFSAVYQQGTWFSYVVPVHES